VLLALHPHHELVQTGLALCNLSQRQHAINSGAQHDEGIKKR
jgi:hypothetical protein